MRGIPRDGPGTCWSIGGGPAGLKAAAVAAERGHRVTLWEAERWVGGQVRLAERLPGRAEFGGAITNLEGEARAGRASGSRPACARTSRRCSAPGPRRRGRRDRARSPTGRRSSSSATRSVLDAWDVIRGNAPSPRATSSWPTGGATGWAWASRRCSRPRAAGHARLVRVPRGPAAPAVRAGHDDRRGAAGPRGPAPHPPAVRRRRVGGVPPGRADLGGGGRRAGVGARARPGHGPARRAAGGAPGGGGRRRVRGPRRGRRPHARGRSRRRSSRACASGWRSRDGC